MNRKLFTALVIAGFAIAGCKQKDDTSNSPQPSKEVEKEIKVIPFIPPTDSSITQKQIKAWSSSNTFLDSLTIMYADSFKINDPIKRMHYQEVFSDAQDKICVINGLTGGYKEYKWILNNIGNPKNKAILDSAGVSVH